MRQRDRSPPAQDVKLCAAHDTRIPRSATLLETIPGQTVNQLAFGFGAVSGLLCAAIGAFVLLWRMRPRRQRANGRPSSMEVFEQWPTTALVLDPLSGGIVAANPAAARSLGYAAEDLLKLPFTQLFSAEGVEPRSLIDKLQQATSRAPLEMRQHCRNGSQRNVEATGRRLMLGERAVLAVAVHDITERHSAETQHGG